MRREATRPASATPTVIRNTIPSAQPRPSPPLRSPIAVIAPPTPAPSAVPRMSESCSADDAEPCSAGADRRSTTSVSAEYAKPMPMPVSAQVTIEISGGTPGATASRVSSEPSATSAKPIAMNRRGPARSIRRAWNQVPADQATVVAVNTTPVSVAGVSRQVWSSSGR